MFPIQPRSGRGTNEELRTTGGKVGNQGTASQKQHERHHECVRQKVNCHHHHHHHRNGSFPLCHLLCVGTRISIKARQKREVENHDCQHRTHEHKKPHPHTHRHCIHQEKENETNNRGEKNQQKLLGLMIGLRARY